MPRGPSPTLPHCLLIYDKECRLCVTAKKGLEQQGLGAKVCFIPYQSEEAKQALGGEYKPGRPPMAYLVETDGTIQRGLDAFLPLLPGLVGGRVVLGLWRISFLRPVAYWIYRVVARYRYQWFGSVHEGKQPPTTI